MTVGIQDYRWLVSDAAKPWLALASEEMSGGKASPMALTARLRKDLTVERTHLVIEQAELRPRARAKFSLADRMFFTRKGLEQATDEQIASYKAARFPTDQTALDLCCGIGGDLLSLARRGSARGVERDSVVSILVAANVRAAGLPHTDAEILTTDATQVHLRTQFWHCDPDRRKDGRRTTHADFFEPPLEALELLLRQSGNAAIKLAPATIALQAWRETAELEWISSRGECRQQVAWSGSLARHPGKHAATVVTTDGRFRTITGQPDETFPVAGEVRRYLYETDAAVLAAKLTAALCQPHQLGAVSAGIPYLTSDALVEEPALDAFEVVDVLPLDRKQLKAYCRERSLGRLEIKKRGVEIAPERLRKEIVAKGENATTILLTPVSGKAKAVVAKRIKMGDEG